MKAVMEKMAREEKDQSWRGDAGTGDWTVTVNPDDDLPF